MELDCSSDNNNNNNNGDKVKTVVVTYKDEDEDVITISTNEELSDAFFQFVHKVPPVLRATANISLYQKKRWRESPPPQVGKCRADKNSIAGEMILESLADNKTIEEVDDDSWHYM